jgi:uncharacterized protein YndB with AHSA1/START domain
LSFPRGISTLAATEFALVSEWRLAAPIDRVWTEIATPEQWPEWWRAVKRVEMVKAGDASGIGAVRRFTWATALPYTISFDLEVTRIEPPHMLEGEARGELRGTGLWTLTPEGGGTHVRYDWRVELQLPWQRALAPLLRPLFAWNHNVVLGWGEQDIRRRLGIG